MLFVVIIIVVVILTANARYHYDGGQNATVAELALLSKPTMHDGNVDTND